MEPEPSLPNLNAKNSNLGHQGHILVIIAVFFIFLLPVLSQPSTYHSDEHFYTDAAIYMLQHSDYLTPHYADGTLRTKKPIGTYWLLMASYAIFGVSFFSARLPFLLAGAATIWVTYKFSRKLFNDRGTALLAAAILASNLQFIMLSLRATPDILQTLFMLISVYGFASLVFHGDDRLRHYLFTYLGAALAIQTKGLLGGVLIVFMAIFLIIAKEKTSMLKHLIHWPVIIAAVGLALSWYLYVYFQHGGDALWRFYNDQVASKIDRSAYFILLNALYHMWGVFRHFIPWSLFPVLGYLTARREIHLLIRQQRKQVLFILSWFLLLLAIFSISSDMRTRYLVPAYPLLSILIAVVFREVYKKLAIQRLWRWCCGFLIVLTGLLGVVLLWIGSILHWQLIMGGVILVGAAIWISGTVIKTRLSPAPVAMGLVMLVTVAVLRGIVIPRFDFAPTRSLTECLLPEIEAGRITSVWSGKRANYLRQLYTASNGQIRVNYYHKGGPPSDLDHSAAIVLTLEEKENFNTRRYQIRQCGEVFQDPDIQSVWQGLVKRDKAAVSETIKAPLFLARLKT